MKPEQRASNRIEHSGVGRISIVVVAVALVTAAVFWQVRQIQLRAFKAQFQSDAAARTALIRQETEMSVLAIKSLGWFLGGRESVDEAAFRAFAAGCLSDRKELQALSWNPRVSAADRDAFERSASRDTPFQITDRNAEGRLATARERQEFYPVLYIEPVRGNEAAVGFDAGSDAGRLEALTRARDTGEPALTHPVQLVQQAENRGFLVFVPVYRRGTPTETVEVRNAALTGFAVGVYLVPTVVSTALQHAEPLGLSLEILDLSGPPGGQSIYRQEDASRGGWSWKAPFFPTAPKTRDTFLFGGRLWAVEMAAGRAYMERYSPVAYWLILPAGFLLALLSVGFLSTVLSSRSRLAHQVAERTAELSQAKEMLRLVLDAIPVRVHWKDRNSVYLGGNRRFAEDAGLNSPADLAGKTDFDLPWKQFAELFRGRDRKVIESGQPMLDYEQPSSTTDGRMLTLRQSKLPLRDAQGDIIGVLSIYEDITQRKAADEALRESEERYRAVVEHSTDGMVVAVDNKVVYVNDAAVRLAGAKQAEQVLGHSILEFVHPDYRAEAGKRRAIMLETGVPSPIVEGRLQRPDGTIIEAEWTGVPIVFGGKPAILNSFRDMTEHRRRARELQESQEQLRERAEELETIMGCAPVALWVAHDPRCDYISANAMARSFDGSAPDNWSANQTSTVQWFRDGRRLNPDELPMQQAAQNDTEFQNTELELLLQNGRRISLFGSATPLHDAQGRVRGCVGAFLDITGLKEAQRALRQANDQLAEANAGLELKVRDRTAELLRANERLEELDRLKSQFLATMSHELRTPLNSIIGFTGILRQGFAGPVNAEQQKQLGLVYGSAKHLLSLINDLLDLSRIEAGKVEIGRDPFNFVEVIDDVIQTLTPMAAQKNLKLSVELPGPVLQLTADRKRCFQVLLNLVNNAVKFTARGEVTISARKEGEALRVCVADTGIGIKPEQMGMLFEAFRQLDGSAKRVYEGTGLGLHLCRKLLTLMHGEIRAESEFGKGSRFTFSLPY